MAHVMFVLDHRMRGSDFFFFSHFIVDKGKLPCFCSILKLDENGKNEIDLRYCLSRLATGFGKGRLRVDRL